MSFKGKHTRQEPNQLDCPYSDKNVPRLTMKAATTTAITEHHFRVTFSAYTLNNHRAIALARARFLLSFCRIVVGLPVCCAHCACPNVPPQLPSWQYLEIQECSFPHARPSCQAADSLKFPIAVSHLPRPLTWNSNLPITTCPADSGRLFVSTCPTPNKKHLVLSICAMLLACRNKLLLTFASSSRCNHG